MDNGYFYSFNKMAYVKGKNRPAGCILCLIKNKDPRVSDLSIFRNENFIVSLNLYPYNPGHLIIFPIRHINDIRLYTNEEQNNLNVIIKYFLDIIDESHKPFGYNLGYNMGLTSGASIEHLHYHIIPRYPREIGISDLIAGKRVLVENPLDTKAKILKLIKSNPM